MTDTTTPAKADLGAALGRAAASTLGTFFTKLREWVFDSRTVQLGAATLWLHANAAALGLPDPAVVWKVGVAVILARAASDFGKSARTA